MIVDINLDQNQRTAAAIMATELLSARAPAKRKRNSNAPITIHIAPGAVNLICTILEEVANATPIPDLALYQIADWVSEEIDATCEDTAYSDEDRAEKLGELNNIAETIAEIAAY